jgi:hypothetical protein
MDGRVKTLHPRIHGGSAGAPRPGRRRHGRARHRPHRPGRGQPLPLRSHRAARLHARRRHREHRHRRPGDAARGGQEPRARDRRGRSRTTTSMCSGRAARAAAASTRHSFARLRWPRLQPHTAPTTRDRQLPRHGAGHGEADFPPQRSHWSSRPPDTALWREPAPAGGLLPSNRAPTAGHRHRRAAAGQGAVLQQHRRHRCRLECVKQFASRPASSSSTPIPAASPSPPDLLEAYERAYATDPTSAFGGIIAFNRRARCRHARAPSSSASSSR